MPKLELKNTNCLIFDKSRFILDIGDTGAFLGDTIFGKKGICLFASLKQMLFLTIFNKNIFLKTQDTELGVIIAPNKVLEQAPVLKEV